MEFKHFSSQLLLDLIEYFQNEAAIEFLNRKRKLAEAEPTPENVRELLICLKQDKVNDYLPSFFADLLEVYNNDRVNPNLKKIEKSPPVEKIFNKNSQHV